MLYSVPFGQVMLHGVAPSDIKPRRAGHVMLYSPANLCLTAHKTQESRHYQALRAIFACCRPLPFVGSATILGATLGATLVPQNELPPDVTN